LSRGRSGALQSGIDLFPNQLAESGEDNLGENRLISTDCGDWPESRADMSMGGPFDVLSILKT
jgi:hypothetical protein